MKRQETANVFTKGLMLDLNPLQVTNDTLTNCLNGTMFTYNGNENVLQNDMGNCQVETAMLPSGYVPLGSTSFGGIIYILSYNPLEKKCQIGSFPSPERNITTDELGSNENSTLNLDEFLTNGTFDFTNQNQIIKKYVQTLRLSDTIVYPNDKYKIFSNNLNLLNYISGYHENNTDANLYPKYLRLDIIAELNNGQVITLTDSATWVKTNLGSDEKPSYSLPYYIYLKSCINENEQLTLEEYRNLVGSQYDVFMSKISGKIGIQTKLEVPTSFSVGYDAIKTTSNNIEGYQFYFLLNWTNDLVGEHKNRVNPYGIKWYCLQSVGQANICLKQTLRTSEIQNRYSIPSNTLINTDYYSTIVPDNYYKYTDEEIVGYLEYQKNEFSNNKLRANDGTDFQYVIKGPFIPSTTGEITLYVVPYMPFGELNFLKQEIKVNLDNLQSGQININNYQYYVTDKDINVSYCIEAYPERGKSISECVLNLYELGSELETEAKGYFLSQDTYNNKSNSQLTKSDLVGQTVLPTPYSGYNSIKLNKSNLNLTPNRIYIAEFEIKYGNTNSTESFYFYRLLFNSSIFNNAYNSASDFKDLKLYSPEQNYGLNLTLTGDNNITNEIDGSGITNFATHETEPKTKNINQVYKVTNTINNNQFRLDSGLGDELSINGSELQIQLGNSTCTISDKSHDEIFTNNSQFTEIAENGKQQLQHTFDFNVPGTLYYNKPVSLKVYKLTNLVDGKDTYRIMLNVWAREENEGYLRYFVNSTGNINTSSQIVNQYECANEVNDYYIDLSPSIYKHLQRLMDGNKNFDYISILFGVDRLGDNDCGYGYEENGISNVSYFYRFNGKPENCYMVMTAIRDSQGSVILLHTSGKFGTAGLNQLSGSRPVENDSYKKFDAIYKNNPADNMNPYCNKTGVIPDNLQKYTYTNKQQTFFELTNFDIPENPSLTVNYPLKVTVSGINVKIDNKLIQGVSINNGVVTNNVTNLKLDITESLNINTEVPIIVSNSQFLTRQYELKQYVGIEESSGTDIKVSIKSDDIINHVYSSSGGEIGQLEVKDNNVQLTTETQSQVSDVKWYFGWEHLKNGSKGSIIGKSDFNESEQSMIIYPTYSMNKIQDQSSITLEVKDILRYSIACNSSEFEIGKEYELCIDRVYNVKEGNYIINITPDTSVNCTKISFTDTGVSPNPVAIIKVSLTAQKEAGITLDYDGVIVSSFTFDKFITQSQTTSKDEQSN